MRVESQSGPGRFHLERRTPAEAREKLEAHILQQGGVRFEMTPGILERGQGSEPAAAKRTVAVLLEMDEPVAMPGEQGKMKVKSVDQSTPITPFVRVAATTEPSLNDVQFRADLADAVPELRTAVLQQWRTMLTNESILDAQAPIQARAEVAQIRERYGAIIAAMDAPTHKPAAPEAIPTAVRPKMEQPLPVDKTAAVELSMGFKVPAELKALLNKPGSIAVVDGIGANAKVGVVRLEIVPNGLKVDAWKVAEVAGATDIQVGYLYKADLTNLPGTLRKALDNTQRSGRSDGLVQQAYGLMRQGDAKPRPVKVEGPVTKSYRERLIANGGFPVNGAIVQLERDPAGGWIVEGVDQPDLAGVRAGQHFVKDLSDAPAAFQKAVPWLDNSPDWRHTPRRGARGRFESRDDNDIN